MSTQNDNYDANSTTAAPATVRAASPINAPDPTPTTSPVISPIAHERGERDGQDLDSLPEPDDMGDISQKLLALGLSDEYQKMQALTQKIVTLQLQVSGLDNREQERAQEHRRNINTTFVEPKTLEEASEVIKRLEAEKERLIKEASDHHRQMYEQHFEHKDTVEELQFQIALQNQRIAELEYTEHLNLKEDDFVERDRVIASQAESIGRQEKKIASLEQKLAIMERNHRAESGDPDKRTLYKKEVKAKKMAQRAKNKAAAESAAATAATAIPTYGGFHQSNSMMIEEDVEMEPAA
ncbi:hypothetical protein N0V90_001052 [Kalmusia sp. IMI 367209]|nr:hypothetical protein N0V90_001052 [Kalmusia sp. IMI 367209]